MKADAALARLGAGEVVNDVSASTARFPDGAHFRIEIPSVEGPRVLDAVVQAAAEHGDDYWKGMRGSSGHNWLHQYRTPVHHAA